MSDVLKYKCKQCEKTFKVYSTLRHHIAMKHSDWKYSCDKCGKQFAINNTMKIHHYDCQRGVIAVKRQEPIVRAEPIVNLAPQQALQAPTSSLSAYTVSLE